MKFGIQRRSINLVPATDEDVQWIGTQFNKDETWRMFGYGGPARYLAMMSYFQHPSMLGVIRKADTNERIGFIAMFRTEGEAESWQFGYSIPEAKHRNAFAALFSVDAMSHYAFDHHGIDEITWSVHSENGPALAIIKRLGYQQKSVRDEGDCRYIEFSVDKKRWEKRRARLFRASDEPFCISKWKGELHLMGFLAELTQLSKAA
jgi:RimJ/RimL family protein N-acetyltransferase